MSGTLGGNDAELSSILNQCIFGWAALAPEAVKMAKEAALKNPDLFPWAAGFDWDSLAHGCENQLDRTRDIIAGAAFSKSLDSVIAAAKGKLSPESVTIPSLTSECLPIDSGMIYYTG